MNRLNSTTVFTDGTAVVSLVGGNDLDWFWSFGGDSNTDLGNGGTEMVN